MFKIGNSLISDELIEKFFVCDLQKCKGACCVEGDLGAPLERNELKSVRDSYQAVEPYLTEESKKQIKEQGFYVKDFEGDYSTPTVNGRECVYAVYDKKGILKCSFEKAWKDGKTPFRKPVSCHLYPVRIRKKYNNFYVNYNKWSICNPACKLGETLNMPVYVFVKDALIRKFGQKWYDRLDKIARNQLTGKKGQE